MIDKLQRQKIAELAYKKYLYRRDNNINGCALGDWLDSERDLADKRQITNCPIDNYPLFIEDDKVICPKSGCLWQVESKRKTDKNLPDFSEVRKDFNG